MKRLLLGMVLLTTSVAHGADFQEGINAYNQGDYEQALAEFRALAEQGHTTAQYNLGVMYANGDGVSQDQTESVRWYREAAEQGYADAQNALGVRYSNGDGVAQDDTEAVRWYREAAEQGHAEAQDNLGVMYANGDGVAQDQTEAVRWYREAAEQGHAEAQWVPCMRPSAALHRTTPRQFGGTAKPPSRA